MISKETRALNEQAVRTAGMKVKATYSPDKILMQAVEALKEGEHSINIEYERLREMFWRYYPELSSSLDSIIKLINAVMSDIKVPKNSMGYELSPDEIQLMRDYAQGIKSHVNNLKKVEDFIKTKATQIAPEASKIASPLITAKLMSLAHGMRNLAMMPASTIQLLGAEKALFRHLRTRARPPKHGIIIHHENIQKAKNKGQAARRLANKISIAIRRDYFK
ncbi:MAG: hypothetical protein WC307_00410 [Candidatus Nanoarchaeia archaeon]|jgi:nucleolar protein 56